MFHSTLYTLLPSEVTLLFFLLDASARYSAWRSRNAEVAVHVVGSLSLLAGYWAYAAWCLGRWFVLGVLWAVVVFAAELNGQPESVLPRTIDFVDLGEELSDDALMAGVSRAVTWSADQLSGLSVAELKRMCAKRNKSGYSKMRKADLVATLAA